MVKIIVCPECGGAMEKLYTHHLCLECYYKITNEDIITALEHRIQKLTGVVRKIMDHTGVKGEARDRVEGILNEKHNWEEKI